MSWETLRQKYEKEIKKANGKSEQADAIIWISVTVNAGLGVVP